MEDDKILNQVDEIRCEIKKMSENTKSLVNINKTYLEEIRDYIFTMKRIMVFWFILTLLGIGVTIYSVIKFNTFISALKGY